LIQAGWRRPTFPSCRRTAAADPSPSIVSDVCRSIKTLRHADEVATDDEIRAAARQFVRKVSGFTKPTAKHEAAFEGAVDEITVASQRLLVAIAANLSRHHS
jgi:hypothetical protein